MINLHRKPYGRTSPLISALMAKNILGQVTLGLMIIYGRLLMQKAKLRCIYNLIAGTLPAHSGLPYSLLWRENVWYRQWTINRWIQQQFHHRFWPFCSEGSEDTGAKSRAGNVHFTMIFNVFVLMTLFNEINARYVDNFFHSFLKLQKG